jgi:hypothetical protein
MAKNSTKGLNTEKGGLNIVYHIQPSKDGERGFWNKVGRAFVNSDGSVNLILSYVPTQVDEKGEVNLTIRAYVPKEEDFG